MAKENTCYLFGRVLRNLVRMNEEQTDYYSSKIILYTPRRSLMTPNYILTGQTRWDMPCVYSRNAGIIEYEMKDIHQGDLIFVKGTLCTMDASRKFVCPKCGNVQIVQGAVVVYIDPIFVGKVKEGFTDREYQQLVDSGLYEDDIQKQYPDLLTETQALKILEESAEIGNQIFIDGTVCQEPTEQDFYHDEQKNTDRFQFQIASHRIRRIAEDPVEKRTDFPWVKCYGPNAAEYQSKLHLHSQVFINGAIQTREIRLVAGCENCGALIEKKSIATEIVPFHVEYLNLGTNPDEEDEEEDW